MLFALQFSVFIWIFNVPINQFGNCPFCGLPWVDCFIFENTCLCECSPVPCLLETLKVLADRWVALPPNLHLVGRYTCLAGPFLDARHVAS